jgi:hypothetical protein
MLKKFLAAFILIWILPDQGWTQEMKFMVGGTAQVKYHVYDPEVPFAKDQSQAELYVQLFKNDSLLHEWGPTNNSNFLYLAQIKITCQKSDQITLKCYDEDNRKSLGINRDDLVLEINIPSDSIFTTNNYLNEADLNRINLHFYPIHDASFQILSFTPHQPFKGKIKRGLKKEGLQWHYSSTTQTYFSETVKSVNGEKIVWNTAPCMIAECYFGKPISFYVNIPGKYYIDLISYNTNNAYEMRWGEQIINTTYGDLLLRIEKTN